MNTLQDVSAEMFLGEGDGCYTPPYNPPGTPGARDAEWPERTGVMLCGADFMDFGAVLPPGTANDSGKTNFLKSRLASVNTDFGKSPYTEDYASRDKYDLDDCNTVLNSLDSTSPIKILYQPMYNQALATYYAKVAALTAAEQQKLAQQKLSDSVSSDTNKNKTNPLDAVVPTSTEAQAAVAAGMPMVLPTPAIISTPVAAQATPAVVPTGPLDDIQNAMTSEVIPGVPNYIPTAITIGGIIAAVAYLATR